MTAQGVAEIATDLFETQQKYSLRSDFCKRALQTVKAYADEGHDHDAASTFCMYLTEMISAVAVYRSGDRQTGKKLLILTPSPSFFPFSCCHSRIIAYLCPREGIKPTCNSRRRKLSGGAGARILSKHNNNSVYLFIQTFPKLAGRKELA